MWWYDHLHECMLEVSLLLEMVILVTAIILECFRACRKEAGKVSVLGRPELVPSSLSRRVCPVWHDRV